MEFNEKTFIYCVIHLPFHRHQKTIKYVAQEKQDNFSCKHENTLKSMEFSEGDEQLRLLTRLNQNKILLTTETVGYLNRAMITADFRLCEYKDADQLRSNCEAVSQR